MILKHLNVFKHKIVLSLSSRRTSFEDKFDEADMQLMTENPDTADSQREPPIQRLRDQFFETTSCMCRFGMVGKKGLPFLKRVRWIATDKRFTDAVDLQCQQDHLHEKVEGSNTALSAQYPPQVG